MKLACCSCYFDLVLYMKNNNPEFVFFFDANNGCLNVVKKMARLREKIKTSCRDFIGLLEYNLIALYLFVLTVCSIKF